MGSVGMMSDAARRVAECLLRSLGGRAVMLRMPVPPGTATAGDELGLAVPEFEDVEIAPVVFRRARPQVQKTGERWELMVSAAAIESALGLAQTADAGVLFAGAAGVLVDGVLLEIESAAASDAGGRTYVYRLTLRVPEADRV